MSPLSLVLNLLNKEIPKTDVIEVAEKFIKEIKNYQNNHEIGWTNNTEIEDYIEVRSNFGKLEAVLINTSTNNKYDGYFLVGVHGNEKEKENLEIGSWGYGNESIITQNFPQLKTSEAKWVSTFKGWYVELDGNKYHPF